MVGQTVESRIQVFRTGIKKAHVLKRRLFVLCYFLATFLPLGVITLPSLS